MQYNKRWVIGDIHGKYEQLVKVLELANFDITNDLLISLGDLADRGEESWEVIDYLCGVPNLILIEGNHDYYIKEWLRTNRSSMEWIYNGGNPTIKSYESHEMKNREKHLDLLNSNKPYYVLDNKCFVHGGLDPNHLIKEHSEVGLTWDRSLSEDHQKDRPIIFKDGFDEVFIGHTPTTYYNSDTPIIKNNVINVDTGCGKGGLLTIMNIDTKEFFQA